MPSTSEHPSAAHLKGAAFGEFLEWYFAHHQGEALREAVARLPPEARAGLDPRERRLGVVASTWYPAPAVHAVLDAFARAHPDAERAPLVHDGVQVVVTRMFRGLYAVLFELVATPERYTRHIQRAWRQLHDTGQREVQLLGPGEALSITSQWGGHHPVLCELTVETMCAVFERMGCKRVSAQRLECVSRGAHRCSAQLRWTR